MSVVFVRGRKNITDAQMRALLELNNQHVPAVNHLELDAMEAIVAEASLFVVAVPEEAPKEGAAPVIAAYLICMGPGAKYDSLNYQYYVRAFDNAGFLYVDRIVVAEAYHRRGLGTKLYNLVAEEAQAGSGVKHLCCEVNVKPPNETSMKFHRQAGFNPVGEQDVEGGSKRVSMLVREV